MLKEPEEMFEFGSVKDFQLQQALNHLTGKKVDQGGITKEKPKGLSKEEMEAVKPSDSNDGSESGDKNDKSGEKQNK